MSTHGNLYQSPRTTSRPGDPFRSAGTHNYMFLPHLSQGKTEAEGPGRQKLERKVKLKDGEGRNKREKGKVEGQGRQKLERKR